MFKLNHLLTAAPLFLLATALPALEPHDGDAECIASLSAYSSSSIAFEESYTVKVVTSSAYNYQKADPDAPATTLCDGRPRVISSLARTTETYDSPLTETIYSYYTEPTPTCTVAASALPSDLETYTPCTAGIPGYCFIYGDINAKVFYWPVTTVSGDFCSQDGSTIFAEPTSPPQPDTVVVDDHTFTSPTPYISIGNAFAQLHGERHKRTRCGTRGYDDIVVPLTADNFKSVRWGSDDTYSFNFADFNTAPVDAFDGQRRCRFDGECATIKGEYTPMLPLPTEIRNLDQEWKDAGCREYTEYQVTAVALATPAPAVEKRWL
jgi:hypothetical protein